MKDAVPRFRPAQTALAGARPRGLADARVRARYGITVVGGKRPGQAFTYATPETVVEEGDVIIASGPIRDVERFSELT